MSWVRPTRADLLLAGLVTLFGIVTVLIVHPGPGAGASRDADGWAVALAVLVPAVTRNVSPATIAPRRSVR